MLLALVKTSLAPSRSWMFAACTTTTSNNPSVSTKMCRLIPLIFFPRVIPPRAAGSGRLDRLAVDAAGAGLGFLSHGLANLTAERVVNLLPQPAPAPAMEIVADRPFRREVMRQSGPRTACAQEIEDGIEDLAEVGGPRSTRPHRRRQRWL